MELDYSQYKKQHIHILGINDVDTSHITAQLFLEDSAAILIDPIGDVSLDILRRSDKTVVFYDVSDTEYPITVNPFFNISDEQKPIVADAIVDSFLNLWYGDFPATRVIDCLVNTVDALLDYPDGTLLGIKFMLTDEEFRTKAVATIQNPVVLDYWKKEFPALSAKDRSELVSATRSNIHRLIVDPRIRNIFGMPKPTLDFRDIIDKKKKLVIRIPQSKFGRRKTKLLGSIFLSMIHQASRTRKRRSHYRVYVTKCSTFSEHTLVEMIDTIGQHKVSLTLVHRYLGEISPELHDAAIGSIDFKFVFRLGQTDTNFLEKNWQYSNTRESLSMIPNEFFREVTPESMLDLLPENTSISTLPKEKTRISDTVELSRRLFGKRRDKVEGYIDRIIGVNSEAKN